VGQIPNFHHHQISRLVMTRLLLTLTFTILFLQSNSQDLSELEKRHGFKDIRLGMVVDSVRGVKFKKDFKEQNQYAARLYSVDHPDYSRIGEVKVKDIELKAYNDLVYEINVIVDKDTRLMKALESIYGKANYDMKNETYFWRAESLILKFRSSGKHNLELQYTSFLIHKMMREDKEKKVDDIANDF
jgi:hypothetical protein